MTKRKHEIDAIPDEALNKHIAILGITGSGKTSLAKTMIVEGDLRAKRRVIIIDPTGAWWGLRLKRDGKTPCFPIYIFGGEHGDYPLRAVNSTMLAEVFATSNDSAIFDLSGMTVSERTTFFTEFTEAFLRQNKSWVRFVIDEAHLFMPQQGASAGGGAPRMLHAGNNLVNLGRSRGLRIVLISQRPAKLHKDSLTQVTSLVAMQMTSPQDRNAILGWIADNADPERGREIVGSLPVIGPGVGWLWAPLAHVMKRIYSPLPSTFDSSSAPEHDAAEGPTLQPINLATLKSRLSAFEEKVKQNDPVALKAEIARLKQVGAGSQGAARSDEIAAADNAGWTRGRLAGYQEGYSAGWTRCAASVRIEIGSMPAPEIPEATPQTRTPPSRTRHGKPAASAAPAGKATSSAISVPKQRVLDAVAWWKGAGIEPVSRVRVCVVAGYSPKASTFGVYVAELVKDGYLETGPGTLRLSAAGCDAASALAFSRFDSLQRVCSKHLSPAEARVFDAIVDAYPSSIRRDALADKLALSRHASTLGVYLARITSLGFAEVSGQGEVKASAWLFNSRA